MKRNVLATLTILASLLGSSLLADSIILSWTAPGDDGSIGTASVYDLRYAETFINESNWDLSTPVVNLPNPLPAGNNQQHIVD